MTGLRAGALYFALVFAAGAVLGTVRELWLTPRIGGLAATLIEAPLMLGAMILAARWVIRRLGVPRGARFAMGAIALALLFAAEFGLAWALRGVAPRDHAAGLLAPAGLVFLGLAALFAAMPSIVLRRAADNAGMWR